MPLHRYQYALLRYCANPLRNEGLNVGIIVQSDDAMVEKVHGRFQGDRRLETADQFDRDWFRRWRQFITDAVQPGVRTPLTPEPYADAMWEYLHTAVYGNFQLTEPVSMVTAEASIVAVRDRLFRELVLPPEEAVEEEPTRPVARFRHELERRKLDRHPGLHRDTAIDVDGTRLMFDYWLKNGRYSVIQTVAASLDSRAVHSQLDAAVIRLDGAQQYLPDAHRILVMDRLPALRALSGRIDEGFVLAREQQLALLSDKHVRDVAGASALVDMLERELGAAGG